MNGYFQLVVTDKGTGIKVIAPTEGGNPVPLAEVRGYLDQRKIVYDLETLNGAVTRADGNVTLITNAKILPERESYRLTVSDDQMTATAYFYPPTDGAKGELMTAAELKNDLSFQKITYGIQEAAIEAFFKERAYCTDIVLAQGKLPRQGKDAVIEYLFSADLHAKPEVKEDGSVDFFNLNLINHCQAGDVLARLTPEDPGEDGWNIYNKPVLPDKVEQLTLKGNKNTAIAEDGLSLSATVNGHVGLHKGEVIVSNVFTVEVVDASTGNIDYDGSVVIKGNVESGFTVKARGDIEVKGSVGAALLDAKGSVVIAGGINGGAKGEIKSKGNVVSKFIEGAMVKAGGTVSAGSIMRSTVQAGTEVYVDGKRGFIAGGQVSARERVTAKTLGSDMGANTLIEVGVDPTVKENVKKMQAQIADAQKKKEAIAGPLANLMKLMKSGAQLKPEQQKYLQQMLMQTKILDSTITKNTEAIAKAQEEMQEAKRAEVIVMDTAYPGTTIGINELQMIIKSPVKFSRFVIKDAEIRVAAV